MTPPIVCTQSGIPIVVRSRNLDLLVRIGAAPINPYSPERRACLVVGNAGGTLYWPMIAHAGDGS